MIIAIIIFLAFVVFFTFAGMFVNDKENSDICCFCGMVFAITCLILAIIMYSDSKPTLNDVPEKAHIDTVLTIHNNDTVYSYQIEWNDKK